MIEVKMDQIVELLSGLSLNPNKQESLRQIKTALSSLNPSQVFNIFNVTTFKTFFEILSFELPEVELTCDILNTILSHYPPDYVLLNFEQELKDGLGMAEYRIKQLVLQQILRSSSTPEAFVRFLSQPDVLIRIISLYADKELSIVKIAQSIVSNLSKYTEGLELLLSPPALTCYQELIMENAVIKYRVFEMIISICKLHSTAFSLNAVRVLLNELLRDLDNEDDVLVQLNCLQMLTELAMVSHGLIYLEDVGVIHKLENKLKKTDSDVSVRFILPGLFKFFGYVGNQHPHRICEKYRDFIGLVYKAVDSNENSALQSVAIQTVGIIGSTADGKRALNNLGNYTLEIIKCLGKYITNSPTELRITSINAVENLLSLRIQREEITNEDDELLKNWFNHLSENPMKLFLDICKHPFCEVRCAVFGVFKEMVRQRWGQQIMSNYPGFVEFLLDRSTESDIKGKQLKYEIIESLVRSGFSAEYFGNVNFLRFRQYVNEGAYYVKVESAVAVDGEN